MALKSSVLANDPAGDEVSQIIPELQQDAVRFRDDFAPRFLAKGGLLPVGPGVGGGPRCFLRPMRVSPL